LNESPSTREKSKRKKNRPFGNFKIGSVVLPKEFKANPAFIDELSKPEKFSLREFVERPQIKDLLKKLGVFFSIIVLVFIGLFALKNLAYFKIKEILIDDSEGKSLLYVDEQKIIDATSTLKGVNYFEANIAELASEIKASNYAIKEIFTDKNFPNGVRFSIVERIPFLTMNLNNQSCVIVDKEAYVQNVWNPSDKKFKEFVPFSTEKIDNCRDVASLYNIPYVSFENTNLSFHLGTQSNEYLINSIKEITDALYLYRYAVNEINVEGDDVKVKTVEGLTFYFSMGSDLETQIMRFKAVHQYGAEFINNESEIDLRYVRPVDK